MVGKNYSSPIKLKVNFLSSGQILHIINKNLIDPKQQIIVLSLATTSFVFTSEKSEGINA
jgi:hypothetical protein